MSGWEKLFEETPMSPQFSLKERRVRAFEKMADALGDIAEALTAGYKLDQHRFDKEYPIAEPKVGSVGKAKFDIDKRKQGIEEEPNGRKAAEDDKPFVDFIGRHEQRIKEANEKKKTN